VLQARSEQLSSTNNPRQASGMTPNTHSWSRARTDVRTSIRMRRVRRAGTGPEQHVLKALRASRLKYSTANHKLPGSPDFANQRRQWAIFVHGCFWHAHVGCRRARLPMRNRRLWQAKFLANTSRDRRVQLDLRRAGYRVFVIWECQLRKEAVLRRLISKLLVPAIIQA
jgi:DNA mismatch endonuclease (patch repair protein)